MAPSSKRRRKPESIVMADNVPNLPKSFVKAGEVLDLPELLEMIILNLPMRDMQRFRRVSKQWQATVDNSLPIKRALFQEPGTTADLAYDDYSINSKTKRVYRGTKYSTHPHFPPPGAGPGGYLDVLTKRAHRIPNVFLTQPPAPSARIVVMLRYNQPTKLKANIELEANETFGSLNEKIVQAFELRLHDASKVAWWWYEVVNNSDSDSEED
ncbi:hypothetical protein LTR97_003905 [Elasticomyces elasticus]|uniref:F-box domain-containing protein n=1 Tax=Elasticomyces elasticus TaxID=574655 RepID=A0AAN8A378_9PEZI|nr:hypothetical protein LTR97_003905 [Elasticomyces elasticus]